MITNRTTYTGEIQRSKKTADTVITTCKMHLHFLQCVTEKFYRPGAPENHSWAIRRGDHPGPEECTLVQCLCFINVKLHKVFNGSQHLVRCDVVCMTYMYTTSHLTILMYIFTYQTKDVGLLLSSWPKEKLLILQIEYRACTLLPTICMSSLKAIIFYAK